MVVRIVRSLGLIFIIFNALISASVAESREESQYQSIDWVQLMPEDDLNALLNPPDTVQGIVDGSAMDNVDALGKMGETDEDSQRYYKALNSARVITEFDNTLIRLPGFIVPLASDEQNRVTEFFIVPYFGACLHMPPPPPNQIVYAKIEEGIALDSIYNPFWFEGKLVIEGTDHALGNAAYRLNLDEFYPYEE